jgi:peptidoglycan/xylan/chitin deacetylase (PgdA/CDA1 family)
MLVLNFHGIGTPPRALDDGERDVWLNRRQFLEILEAVGGRADVRLTFDDGNSSDVEEALPALVQRGVRAQWFVCAGRLGAAGFVDADGVRELRSAGMEVGSHGFDHVRWRNLGRPQLEREIVQARKVLEDVLEEPVELAACPFGAYDRRALGALRDAGFARVYTSDGGPARSDDWLVARNTVHRWDSAESVERMLNGSNGTASLARRAKRWVKHLR